MDEGTEESISSIRTVLSSAATMNRTADESVIMNRTTNGIIVWEVVMKWYERPDLTVNSNGDWLAYGCSAPNQLITIDLMSLNHVIDRRSNGELFRCRTHDPLANCRHLRPRALCASEGRLKCS